MVRAAVSDGACDALHHDAKLGTHRREV